MDVIPAGEMSSASEPGLALRMRNRVAGLHRRAERTGIVAALLKGNMTQSGYSLYLRNLLPAYQAMERALLRHRDRAAIAPFAQPALYRAEAIQADLDAIAPPGWLAALPLVPAAERYAARIAWARDARADLLLAHAYTRYLGDLSGGQIMRTRLQRLFGADFRATAFADFPAIADVAAFKDGFRTALDEAGQAIRHPDRVVKEAAIAFEMNIQLSGEVAALSGCT